MPPEDALMTRSLPWRKKARRQRLADAPWPQAWDDILTETTHASVLVADQQTKWRRLIRVLIAEKKWDGCDGLTITDTVKVTIASQAALMILEMPHDYFSGIRSIVVFPSAFELLQEEWQEKPGRALGLAPYDAVLLAWDTVATHSRKLWTGRNLVIHEFAHHLDFEDGYTNGRPVLPDKSQCVQWREVMSAAFAKLSRDLSNGCDILFRYSAGDNPTEFFAEASERFFTVPLKLRHFYPAVYDVLERYYGLKTIEWFGRHIT